MVTAVLGHRVHRVDGQAEQDVADLVQLGQQTVLLRRGRCEEVPVAGRDGSFVERDDSIGDLALQLPDPFAPGFLLALDQRDEVGEPVRSRGVPAAPRCTGEDGRRV